jgi:hypothetical protein
MVIAGITTEGEAVKRNGNYVARIACLILFKGAGVR